MEKNVDTQEFEKYKDHEMYSQYSTTYAQTESIRRNIELATKNGEPLENEDVLHLNKSDLTKEPEIKTIDHRKTKSSPIVAAVSPLKHIVSKNIIYPLKSRRDSVVRNEAIVRQKEKYKNTSKSALTEQPQNESEMTAFKMPRPQDENVYGNDDDSECSFSSIPIEYFSGDVQRGNKVKMKEEEKKEFREKDQNKDQKEMIDENESNLSSLAIPNNDGDNVEDKPSEELKLNDNDINKEQINNGSIKSIADPPKPVTDTLTVDNLYRD